jgi:hypothetical protein
MVIPLFIVRMLKIASLKKILPMTLASTLPTLRSVYEKLSLMAEAPLPTDMMSVTV